MLPSASSSHSDMVVNYTAFVHCRLSWRPQPRMICAYNSLNSKETPMTRMLPLVVSIITVTHAVCATASAADELSSSILLPNQDWEVEADSLGFVDGLTCDKAGNLFFSDLRSKPAAIYTVRPDGTLTKLAEASRSGLKIGPDGLLYACGSGKIAAYDPATGKETILAENLQPND